MIFLRNTNTGRYARNFTGEYIRFPEVSHAQLYIERNDLIEYVPEACNADPHTRD